LSLFNELKRRNVFRVGAAYIVAAWLLIQVAETIFPLFGFDETPARIVVVVLAIGFIPSLIFAWAFELTPEGLKKDKDVDSARSIAVLPFADMSPEGDQAYFSDGIAEDLLNVLARLKELRVISRSSSFALRDDDLSIPEVAEKLNAAYVLEGSVRKADNQVRITVQLIEARSDTHLWSETYDRELDSIFQIQDEIAAAVVDGLKITLLGAIPGARETDTEVYSLYLQGKYLITPPQGDREDLENAVTAFEQALAIDPDYAPAWLGLSWAYEFVRREEILPKNQAIALARETAPKPTWTKPCNSNPIIGMFSWARLPWYRPWDSWTSPSNYLSAP